MKGLELSKKFFDEYGMPMLQRDFPDILPFLAAGLIGSGSECFGFDDDISRDHDFEPGFCIFIPDEIIIDRQTAFRLERAYSKLPKEFMGFKRLPLSPVGGNRHGVININEFFEKKTGFDCSNLSLSDWFSIPEYTLAEAVNGEIFFDNFGLITQIRNELSNMPKDVRLKKLAGNLLIMGQSAQYNYGRCISRNDTAAAQLCIIEFVKAAINAIFLINKKYSPYYKWSFRALKNLPFLSSYSDMLEFLISSSNDKNTAAEKVLKSEQVCNAIINEIKNQGVSEYNGTELEGHAYAVNSAIKNNEIRNLHILYAV